MKFTPKPYQQTAIDYTLDRLLWRNETGVGLFLEPGLGKTAISLSVLSAMKRAGAVNGTLIAAPLRVVDNVWPDEIAKWDQFNRFTVQTIHGDTELDRIRALNTPADFHLINVEGLQWLAFYLTWSAIKAVPSKTLISTFRRMTLHEEAAAIEAGQSLRRVLRKVSPKRYPRLLTMLGKQMDVRWSGFILDESTTIKNADSQRFYAIKSMLDHFKKRLILTGTPTPQSVIDLWSKLYVLDRGQRLFENITQFRSRYCFQDAQKHLTWTPFPAAAEGIKDKIKDICLYMSSEDHLDLPPCITHDVMITLSEPVMKAYKQMERELFAELETCKGIDLDEEASQWEEAEANTFGSSTLVASSAGAKYNLCKQIACGGHYEGEGADRKARFIHDEKAKAVKEIHDELGGKPVLVAIAFRHDLERLNKVYKRKLQVIYGGISSKVSSKLIRQWNNGELDILVVHPASLSHGVNMQSGPGRDLIWMGLTDSLELFMQLNKRLHRQGVVGQVRIHKIIAKDTVDMINKKRLDDKEATQQSLLDALKLYSKGSGE